MIESAFPDLVCCGQERVIETCGNYLLSSRTSGDPKMGAGHSRVLHGTSMTYDLDIDESICKPPSYLGDRLTMGSTDK